jgi:hypothetical protein
VANHVVTRAVIVASAVLVIVAVAIVPLAYASHELVDAAYPIMFAPAFGAVGAVIALRQPRNLVGWILVAIALLVGGSFDVEAYADLVYRLGYHGLPFGRLAVILAPCWYPGLIMLPLAVLLFPDGRLPSRRWRPVVAVYGVAGAAMIVAVAGLDAPALLGRHMRVDSSGDLYAIDHPRGWEASVIDVALPVFVVFLLACVIGQVLAFRHSTGVARQQRKALLGGVAVCVGGLLCSLGLGSINGHFWYVVSNAAFLAIVGLPIGIGVGILRYRLYEIDRLVSRTVSYAVLTATLAGVFLGTVVLVGDVLPFSSPVAVAASTLAAAALFNPLRRRTQHVVDRRFNRARYDAEATVQAFTAHLRGAIDLDTVQAGLVDAVNRAVEPVSVSVWIATKERT